MKTASSTLLLIHTGNSFDITGSIQDHICPRCLPKGDLKDIPGVGIYFNDILITGHTDADHLRSLQETLSWLERAVMESAVLWAL